MRFFRRRWQRGEMSGKTMEKEQLKWFCPCNVADSVVLCPGSSILCRREVRSADQAEERGPELYGSFLVLGQCGPAVGLSSTSHCGSRVILLGPRAHRRGASAIGSLQRNSC